MKQFFLERLGREFRVSLLLLGAWGALFGVTSPAAEAQRPSEATASNVSIQLAIQKVYPALVRIYAVAEEPGGGRMQRQRSAGSGVIVSSGGYVVTNHHVAGNAVRLHCTFADGEEVEASRVGTDPLSDVAVLKLKLETRKRPGTAVPVATWGDSSRLKVGDVVLAMGSPMARLPIGNAGHRQQHANHHAHVSGGPLSPGRRRRGSNRTLDRARRRNLLREQRGPPGESSR